MSYLFGDTDLAAKRLEFLAGVFREPTRALLRDALPAFPSIAVAVDLGCGPGFTTRLLAETLPCRQVIGLDSSSAFIDAARSIATPGVSFELHDVTALPLPLPIDAHEIDLIYSRLLLTHLPHPGELIARWIDELRPGGLLLLEEPEWIDTQVPAFSTYLDIVANMLRNQSNELYLGPILDQLDLRPNATRRLSRVKTHAVPNRDAASMFSMNLPNWRDSAFVRAHHPAAEIDALHADLQALAQAPGAESSITWGLRQIAFERAHS
jgi:trans-aconitate 2-methyltransferase